MNNSANWEFDVALLVVVLIVGSIPMSLVVYGLRTIKRKQYKAGFVVAGSGVAVGVVLFWGILTTFAGLGPNHGGLVAEGLSPEGNEYCVIQTYTGDFPGPYFVSLYIRNVDGDWCFHYIEHEDLAWDTAQVEFVDGSAIVSRNGEEFREISISLDAPILMGNPQRRLGENFPSTLSVADLAANLKKSF
jgi:hypothetical protein